MPARILLSIALVGFALLVAYAGLRPRPPVDADPPPPPHVEPSFGIHPLSTTANSGIPTQAASFAAHEEKPKDPPAPSSVLEARRHGPAGRIQHGLFTSIQINLDEFGQDIVGDAGNEPSIAVDPADPNRMVVGWRQFDSTTSNYRTAGVAYSHDGGETWTPGVLEPGVFRSDPVLGSDGFGNFYFSSLTCADFPTCAALRVHLFKSTDGGVTWPQVTDSYGGDKQWFTVDDRTSGMGSGHIYQFWTATQSCCPPNNFARSIDAGATFESPVALSSPPGAKWGTLDVASDGTLYLVGATQNVAQHVVMRSQIARNPTFSPFFELVQIVSLGGHTVGLAGSDSPSPVGLLGQSWIAVDPSDPQTVYVLASVRAPGDDPLDLFFIRSVDGGKNWSAPVDAAGNAGDGSWQWFGMMSVSPDGRIHAAWNDTRDNPGQVNLSRMYYAYSMDGGLDWSNPLALTPTFNSHLGFPQESKMGDYNHMVATGDAVHVAYAATFNGGQDVYYMRIPMGSPPFDELSPEPDGVLKNRFISFVVPNAKEPTEYAIRVRLDSLHHPPGPPNAPDFSDSEGQYRFVRLFRDDLDQPILDCPDSLAFETFYHCAYLDCEPEYRDWSAEFGGSVLHVTGAAVVPSSIYTVALVPVICQGTEHDCGFSKGDLLVATAVWGDVMPGTLNVIDVASVVDKVKGLSTALPEWQTWLRAQSPDPHASPVNISDIGSAVDALKNFPYPYAGPDACP